MTYRTTITTDLSARVQWQGAREIEADSPQHAALLAFGWDRTTKSAFHKGETVRVYVWGDGEPKHANGSPIRVTALDLVSPA